MNELCCRVLSLNERFQKTFGDKRTITTCMVFTSRWRYFFLLYFYFLANFSFSLWSLTFYTFSMFTLTFISLGWKQSRKVDIDLINTWKSWMFSLSIHRFDHFKKIKWLSSFIIEIIMRKDFRELNLIQNISKLWLRVLSFKAGFAFKVNLIFDFFIEKKLPFFPKFIHKLKLCFRIWLGLH